MKRIRGEERAAGTESGLRPASAFVLIGIVLLAVSGKATHLAFFAGGDQPEGTTEVVAPWAEFEITDREGRPLAVSIECFDLTASPQSLWRSHTPQRIATAMARVLPDESPSGLLERLLPPPPEGEPAGLVRPVAPVLLRFDEAAAHKVDTWLLTGDPEGGDKGRIEGIWLHDLGDGTMTLEWAPVVALGRAARLQHLGEDWADRPDLWTRRLLGTLAGLVDDVPASISREWQGLPRAEQRAGLRDAIWAELMPTTFTVLRRKVDPVSAHALNGLCQDESISSWQMQLVPRLDRRHPTRPDQASPVAERNSASDDLPPAVRTDAFSILGHWGVLGPEAALERARSERDKSPDRLEWTHPTDPVERRAWQLETEWRPWSGLELHCASELRSVKWEDRLELSPRTYERVRRSVARDRRVRWDDRRVPDYFASAEDALEVPRCETTLDAELQQFLHEELVVLQERFAAAVTQAIVVDTQTGDVLAVDGVYGYDVSGFAPIRHVFTPGSTMKAIVMAIALDQDAVYPEEDFATFASQDGIRVASRHIREALGAPEEETITAAEGLAHSVNAVLVQIGLRVPAPMFRQKLVDLGYAQKPRLGLGPEGTGHLPGLKKGDWVRHMAHASVSFGHEVSVSLWQHAVALTTLARGGERIPLRLVSAIEQEGQRFELPKPKGQRVLSAQACDQVRTMMALGAREGTGDRVASPEQCPEFDYIGTKTGTTEKVPTEVSLHVEWPRQLELQAQKKPWTSAEYKALVGQRNYDGASYKRRTLYTSSMCAIGRIGDREILVLVVVDEPRAKEKFGADVSGKAAIRLLRRAHGLPLNVTEEVEEPVPAALPPLAFAPSDWPWAPEGEGR